MSQFNSVNEEIRAQVDKVKAQSLPKRIAYFWYYHKWQLIGTAAALLLVGSILHTLLTDHQKLYLTGVFLNTRLTNSECNALIDTYAAANDIDTGKYSVDFDCSLAYDPENPNDSVSTYTPVMMLAYSEGKIGDFVLTDAETFDFFGSAGYYRDLTDVLDEALLAQYKDRLYYYDFDDGNGAVPIAIDISDAPKLPMLGYDREQGVMYSIFYDSPHKEQALAFLAWVYTEK
ncbi:MAG: extracellular solute-binding protein [Clostridium sp.]|nr:extracellular solute-binding protein [Clostridium sp.]